MAREVRVLRATELQSGGWALSLAWLPQEQISLPSLREATLYSEDDH